MFARAVAPFVASRSRFGAVCAVTKTWKAQTILILCNIGTSEAQVKLSGTNFDSYQLRNALHVSEATVSLKDGILTLPAYAIAVLRVSRGIFD